MRISSAFPSDYLKASDLNGRQVTVTMARVTVEKIGKDQKPVLYFQGKQKGMVLNKTNANTIASNYGEDTDSWPGGKLVLFETMVDYQGKSVPAIRVRIAPPQQQQAAPNPPPRPNYPPQGDAYEGPDEGDF